MGQLFSILSSQTLSFQRKRMAELLHLPTLHLDFNAPFQILLDVPSRELLKDGLVIPAVLRSKMSRGCTSVKLFNCYHAEYNVSLSRDPDGDWLLSLGEWRLFFRAVIRPDTKRMCFKLVDNDAFIVTCFDEDGLSYILNKERVRVLQKFLTVASYDSCLKQLTPSGFLSQLDVPSTRDIARYGPPVVKPNVEATIIGTLQRGDVKVDYEWFEDFNDWEAVGFFGPVWTNVCWNNNVEPGYTMLFTKDLDKVQFSLEVFNFANLGISMKDESSDDDELDDDDIVDLTDEEGVEVYGEPSDGDFFHQCRVPQHKHMINLPFFFCKLKQYSLRTKYLNIEKWMVEEFGLHNCKDVVIHYGKLRYTAELQVMFDKRVVGEQTHVVMKLDWRQFAEETGFVEGDILRFQLNLEKCIPFKACDFDVC